MTSWTRETLVHSHLRHPARDHDVRLHTDRGWPFGLDPLPSAVPFTVNSLGPRWTTVSARIAGQEVARVRLERLQVGPRVNRTPLHEQGLVGTLFSPAGGGKHTAILVLGGSEGGMQVGWAALLASHGFAALALAYFGVAGVPPELVNIPLEYFLRGLDSLQGRPEVNPRDIVAIGGSYGAQLALLLAASFPQRLKTVVASRPAPS